MHNTEVNEVREHKHLGCTLQNNCKWRRHIEEITVSCAKRVDVLRSLKYSLSRQTLEHLYKTFILPKLEYASSTWNNATLEQQQDIENIQLAAMRVATGAIKGTKHSTIYNELPWITTYERRRRKNLSIFYKIYHRQAPKYLTAILPSKVQARTNYNLRNKHEIQNTKARTTQYQKSFMPTLTKQWNELPDNIKYIGGLQDFKHHLSQNDKKTPKHYYKGPRKYQIITARMRMKCSALNFHLYNMHIVEEKSCSCGHDTEDPDHYFFNCTNYTQPRIILDNIPNRRNLSLKTLLYGNTAISRRDNTLLIDAVAEYLNQSKRFD